MHTMTDAKFSDLDGKVYKKDLCYHVNIRNLAENLELQFDMAMAEKGETITNAIALAIKNGRGWETPAWMTRTKKKESN